MMVIRNNVIIGLGLNTKAMENIEYCPEVVLNIASSNLYGKIESIAKLTGKQPVPIEKLKSGFDYCGDKFGLAGFTPLESKTVHPLRIQECPIQVECLVDKISRRNGYAIVELSVSCVHADELLLKNGDTIDADLWKPLIYNLRSYHGITESIGRNFKFDN